MKMTMPFAIVALLAGAAQAGAQASGAQSAGQAKPSAYGNSYQGVSQPADEPILTAPPSAAPARATAVSAPAPQARTVPAQPANDPDADIVTTPVSGGPVATTTSRPALKSHVPTDDPDADIVTSVPDDPNQLPEGTPFHARLLEELSADTITPGTLFSAQLSQDVVHMGRVVMPAGSYVHGRVTYVSAGRRIGGQSTMRLTPDEVVLPDGTHYRFRGIVTQTKGSNTKTDSEGYVINKDHPVRTGAEYGMTAGSGAVIGGVVAGPVGAGVGGLIGAGVMTVHWLREKNAAVLPANSQVTFALSAPLTLTPSALPAAATAVPESAPSASTVVPAASTYVEPKVVN